MGHFDKRYGRPACSAGYPLLQNGSRGIYVLVLQVALNALGYTTYTLDGAFGPNTQNAVVAFQRENSLSTDGVVGCATWTRLVNEAVGIGRTPTVIDP
ncbi:MAG: peptidoglycan-binding protein [Erysipelotrichaceae bacterium]|nr:peptidoglycan-binding protein [Erysipelotrichaceae bacterium]